MSEYDDRQYQRMLDQIKDFEAKRIDLKNLIAGMESLLVALENAATGWKSEFQGQAGALEQVYAVALYRKRDLTEADWKLINSAVGKMKSLISQVYSEKLSQDT